MDADIHRWAAEYLAAQEHEPCPARINAIHDAVVMALQTGLFGDARSTAIYEQAYTTYGDAFAAVCDQRGLGRHSHRPLRSADE